MALQLQKAPGAVGPIYQAGPTNMGPRVPDAPIDPAYHWIERHFGTRERYVAKRKRDLRQREDNRDTTLTRGKRSKRVMQWVPVGSRQEEGKGPQGKDTWQRSKRQRKGQERKRKGSGKILQRAKVFSRYGKYSRGRADCCSRLAGRNNRQLR